MAPPYFTVSHEELLVRLRAEGSALLVGSERGALIRTARELAELGCIEISREGSGWRCEYIDDGTYAGQDAVEEALLAAIEEGDTASRLVYADRLEGQGEGARAEFVRTHHEIRVHVADEGPDVKKRRDRLYDLARTLRRTIGSERFTAWNGRLGWPWARAPKPAVAHVALVPVARVRREPAHCELCGAEATRIVFAPRSGSRVESAFCDRCALSAMRAAFT